MLRSRDNALAVAVNTDKPQPRRDEACGMVKTVEMVAGFPAQIAGMRKILKKAQETPDGSS